MKTRSPLTRHLVLGGLALAWIAAVVQSITYRDALWFRYYVVNLVWLQYLFLTLAISGGVILLLGVIRARPRPVASSIQPFVSIIVPAKDEVRVIEGAVRSACAQDYSGGFEVIVVDDGSTDGTRELLERLQTELSLTVVRTRPDSFGKAGALEAGIASSHGDLVAVFDADASFGADVVAKMAAHLADPLVGAVQGRRLIYNADRNGLTRFQADEYGVMQTLFQRARQVAGGFVCLAGNGLIVKRTALDAVGGWNTEALTEDIDLAVRLHLGGWEIRYSYEAEIWEEGVVGLRDFIRQRERWFEGALMCLGEYLPQILRGRMPLLRRADALFFLSGSLFSTLTVLTGYLYALIGVVYDAVVYLQLPSDVMVVSSGFLTLGLLVAVSSELGPHPVRLIGLFARWSVFSFHTMVIVPLALRRYLYGALTGARDWRKTTHEGAARPVQDSRA
jgi:1,2-diacylglycerol 3-beta-glucosyltransferase